MKIMETERLMLRPFTLVDVDVDRITTDRKRVKGLKRFFFRPRVGRR